MERRTCLQGLAAGAAVYDKRSRAPLYTSVGSPSRNEPFTDQRFAVRALVCFLNTAASLPQAEAPPPSSSFDVAQAIERLP